MGTSASDDDAIEFEELEACFIANADGFDERFGVETEKMRHDINYGAIRTSVFDEIIDSLQIDLSQYVFVDIGSGKGKGLLLAAMRPFRSIIGVEFDADCCAIAGKNVAAAATQIPNIDRVEIECMDAFEWVTQKWPAHKNVFVLMYFPFIDQAGAPYLNFFLLLGDALRAAKTNLILAFVNPMGGMEELLVELGFTKTGQNKEPHGKLASVLYSWKTFSLAS